MISLLGAFLAIIVIAIVAWMIGAPDSFAFLATPMSEGGQSPAQLLQSLSLGIIAAVTLFLTFKRTEAVNKQSTAAMQQIQLNQDQLESAQSEKVREEFRHALDMITESDGGELKAMAGMQILEGIVRATPERHLKDAQLVLLAYIREATHDEFLRINHEIKDGFGVFDLSKTWEETSLTALDVKQALDCFSNLKRLCTKQNKEKKAELHGVVISGIDFRDDNLNNTIITGVFDHCAFGNNLRNVELIGCAFKDCLFEGCDLTDAVIEGASFRGCVFKDCIVDNTKFDIKGDWRFVENRHLKNHAPQTEFKIKFKYKENRDQAVAALKTEIKNTRKANSSDPKIEHLERELRQLEKAPYAFSEVETHDQPS